MALELIDTQTTDSNGEASITYTGTGAGEIEFRAKVSTLLQEIFVLTDAIYYDDTSTNTTSRYFINSTNGASIDYANNKLKLTCGSVEGRNMLEFRTTSSTLSQYLGKTVRFKVDLSDFTPSQMDCKIIQGVAGGSVTSDTTSITADGTITSEAVEIDPNATLVRFQIIPHNSITNDVYYATNWRIYIAE